jgi:predicted nuclease of restriction endonuclease-like RecB superfamily
VLTADLVSARRRGGELHLVPLDAAARDRAFLLAKALLVVAASHVGRTREELLVAASAVDVGAREHRLKDGLFKLIEDRCEFDASDEMDPPSLRREVFARASAERAQLGSSTGFDRGAILGEVARRHGTSPSAVERALFADLRGAHTLARFDDLSAEALVGLYEDAQPQAVLLRAVKITVDVRCGSATALRALFRRLRFLRLLHSIAKTDDGHRVVIDGPFSLFESVTKYGQKLALVLPALEPCDAWRLEADVRWGKDRVPLSFRLVGRARAEPDGARRLPLPEEVETLLRIFPSLDTGWEVSVNMDVLELAGIGLSVPDLVFERRGPGGANERVYLEVMGYWSRAAVWKRVELVQAGLAERILFAVSAHLRVSEEVLDGALPSALYVYKRAMSARTIAERLEALAGRSHASVGA